jgi:hypothetical protein
MYEIRCLRQYIICPENAMHVLYDLYQIRRATLTNLGVASHEVVTEASLSRLQKAKTCDCLHTKTFLRLFSFA